MHADVYQPMHVLWSLPETDVILRVVNELMRKLAVLTMDLFDKEQRELGFIQPPRSAPLLVDAQPPWQPLKGTQPNRHVYYVSSPPSVDAAQVTGMLVLIPLICDILTFLLGVEDVEDEPTSQ